MSSGLSLHDPTLSLSRLSRSHILSLSRPSRSHILSLSRPSRAYIFIAEAFTILHCHCRGFHDPTLSLSRPSRSHIIIVIVEAFTILHCHCRGLHDPTNCHCRGLHDPTLSLPRPSRSHILSLSRPSRSYIVFVEAFTIPHIVIIEAFTIPHYGHQVLKPSGRRYYRISVSQKKGTTPCSDRTQYRGREGATAVVYFFLFCAHTVLLRGLQGSPQWYDVLLCTHEVLRPSNSGIMLSLPFLDEYNVN